MKLPPRPKRRAQRRVRARSTKRAVLGKGFMPSFAGPDQPFDLLIEQVAEFVQLGSAKRCKKRRRTVVADDGAVIASIENGDTKRHIETRANIDGDDLVGDYWIADEIEQAALHLAGERSHHALIGARDNHEAMHPADPLDLLLNLAP